MAPLRARRVSESDDVEAGLTRFGRRQTGEGQQEIVNNHNKRMNNIIMRTSCSGSHRLERVVPHQPRAVLLVDIAGSMSMPMAWHDKAVDCHNQYNLYDTDAGKPYPGAMSVCIYVHKLTNNAWRSARRVQRSGTMT